MGGPAAGARHSPTRAFYQGLSEALVTYAKAQIHLTEKLPDGHTRREHLQSLARNGRHVPALHPRPLPALCAPVWAAFCELDAERGGAGLGGIQPITSTQILGWQQLHGIALSGWEVQAIRRIDRERMTLEADRAQSQQPES